MQLELPAKPLRRECLRKQDDLLTYYKRLAVQWYTQQYHLFSLFISTHNNVCSRVVGYFCIRKSIIQLFSINIAGMAPTMLQRLVASPLTRARANPPRARPPLWFSGVQSCANAGLRVG